MRRSKHKTRLEVIESFMSVSPAERGIAKDLIDDFKVIVWHFSSGKKVTLYEKR